MVVQVPPPAPLVLPERSRIKWIAGALAICPFTGPLGVHHFYMKRYPLGVLFLVVTLLSAGTAAVLVFVASLIHGLIILLTPTREFDEKFNPDFMRKMRGL